MALTDVDKVRLLIGIGPNSPFNSFMTDEEIQWFLDYNGGNVIYAARMAAVSLSMQLSGVPSRERVGEIDVWNNISTAYLKALDNFIKDASANTLPNGLMPYASGISWVDMKANDNNPDNVRSRLTQIRLCDETGSFYNDPFSICDCQG